MPTYEYRCEACGHEFEQFQSITAAPIKKCPKCAKNKVKRLISTGAGLIFKGSGFYITDYRDSSYSDKAKSESGATGGDAKSNGEATKSETKAADTKTTETKAEAKPKAEPKPKAEKPSKK
ncbi:MAG TPA: FmdB family zinc ribbon protein [Tepidisphaeraceae bacterium]|jgi:putative FmdB family regulatory protein